MKIPISIWLVIAILSLYALGNGYWFIRSPNWVNVIFIIVPLFGIYGLLRHRPWSQYMIYLLFLFMVAAVAFNTWQAIDRGAWPYGSALENVVSLLPTGFLFLLGVACSIAVFRYFRRACTT